MNKIYLEDHKQTAKSKDNSRGNYNKVYQGWIFLSLPCNEIRDLHILFWIRDLCVQMAYVSFCFLLPPWFPKTKMEQF